MEGISVGITKNGAAVAWPFMNKALGNRHMLTLGLSGQGKTFAIQSLLAKVSKNSISSIIFDYSGSYTNDKIEKELFESTPDNIEQREIYLEGAGINPFKAYEIKLNENTILEKQTDSADRICDILQYAIPLTPKQRSDVYRACMQSFMSVIHKENAEESSQKEALSFDEDGKLITNMRSVCYFLSIMQTDSSQAAYGKIASLADKEIFPDRATLNWQDLIYAKGKVTIIQLAAFTRQLQRLITEFLLYDLWFFTKNSGCESNPFVVVLDECQLLRFTDSSPASLILTEGRKFGWSAWFATQFLGGVFEKDTINRLQQSALQLYFRNTPVENDRIAKELDYGKRQEWSKIINGLQKGQCIFNCSSERPDAQISSARPLVINIPPYNN